MDHGTYVKRLKKLPDPTGREPWLSHQRNVIEHMKVGDPAKPWEWSTINGTMYVGPGKVATAVNNALAQAGIPIFTDEPDATNLNLQLYHLLQWRKHGNPPVADLNSIVEFGGGYGAMAYVVDRLGFRGTYTIVDLPCMALLQEYHLSLRGMNCKVKWGTDHSEPDLLITIHALSETDVRTRTKFLETIYADSYLYCYMNNWFGTDNRIYFASIAEVHFLAGGPPYSQEVGAIYPNHGYVVAHGIT